MSTQSPVCAPPQASLLFFPGMRGLKGDKGDQGDASTAAGPTGPAGAVGVYVKEYVQNGTYYDNAYRRDIVAYNGSFWITNNLLKNGQTTWNAPTISDWAFFGDTLVNVATKIELLYPADILVGLNIVPPGYLKSDNFEQYVSGVLISGAGRLEAYDALINGLISTNTPKFNLGSVTKTMAPVGNASFDIGAIADGDIPVNPIISNITDDTLIFNGWLRGTNTYQENRFGNITQLFDIFLTGIGQNNSAGTDLFYIQVYYRKRTSGGAWSAWTVIGQDTYMNKLASQDQSFSCIRPLKLTGLSGFDDVQFSAGFSKGVSGVASLGGANISVRAYN